MILYFDIETAPIYSWSKLPKNLKKIWEERYCKNIWEVKPSEWYYEKAGLYAEYSRVLCITMCFQHKDKFITKTLHNDDESELLEEFYDTIGKRTDITMAWFNIKNFDMPFLCKRFVIQSKKIPYQINNIGKKPWEIAAIDIMEDWKFAWYMWASLNLICEALWMESPKWWDVDGKNMWKYYHSKDFDIKKVVEYCEKDVAATRKIHSILKYHT